MTSCITSKSKHLANFALTECANLTPSISPQSKIRVTSLQSPVGSLCGFTEQWFPQNPLFKGRNSREA